MLERIKMLAERREDFGFETTLAGTVFANLLDNLKESGYQIHIFYLWVQNADIAIARIADRVRRGGHSVPDEVVRRRFSRSISNYFCLYRSSAHYWALFDNSTETPTVIASGESGNIIIIKEALYDEITEQAKKL